MANKRIERSDLVAPNAITSVIEETVELEAQLTKIVNINKVLLTQNPLKSGEDVKNFNNDLKSVVATTESLDKVTKQLNSATDEEVKVRIKLQRATKAQRDELRDLIVLEDKEAGTLDKLQAQSRKLRRERAALNLDTEKGVTRLKEINAQLDANNQQIKENSDLLKQQRLNVGNYKEDIKEAANELSVFGVNVGQLGDTLTSFAKNPLALASAGLTGLVSLYTSSTSGSRDLRSATNQLSTAFGNFAENLATKLGADGKGGGILNFITQSFLQFNFGTKIAAEARVAAAALNDLENLRVDQAASDRLARQQLKRAEQLRQIRDDEARALNERVAANRTLLAVIDARETQQTDIIRKRIEATKLLLNQDKNNIDLQVELINLQEELADKQEENEGFRSEALTNINSLRREAIALEKESIKNQEEEKKVLEDIREFDKVDNKKVETINQEVEAQDRLATSLEATKDATIRLNQAQEDQARKEADLRAERNAEIDQTIETITNIASLEEQVSSARLARLDQETTKQAEELSRQERRAEQGLENDLANQEKKAAELSRQREEEAKKAERTQKALAYFAQFQELSKENPNTAAFKAAANIAIAETIAGLFYDGAENIDDKTAHKWRNTGKDDFLIGVHGGERVLTATQNSKIGDISNEDLANIAVQYRTGNLGSVVPIMDDRVVSRLESVEKAVKNIHFDIYIDPDSNVTKTEFKNGLKKISTTKRKRLR